MGLTLEPAASWNTWPFGEDLKVEGRSPIPVDEFAAAPDDVTAEGLQTLLFLNLEKVFPDWRLRRMTVATDARGPVAFEAREPTGVRHLFALHDVQTSKTAPVQLLSALIDRFGGRRSDNEFDEASDDRRVAEIACRTLGFWLGIEAMSHPVATLPLREADREIDARLEALVDTAEESWDVDRIRRAARGIADRWDEDDDATVEGPSTGVHLHLVVADVAELDSAQLEMMRQLRDQGLRLDVWEIALDSDRGRRRGTLGIRPARFPDNKPTTFVSLGDRRPTELVAEMARQNPALHREIDSWERVPDYERTIVRTRLSIDEPCDGPYFSITARDDDIEFKTSMAIPEHIDEAYSLTDLRTQVTPEAMEAIRSWVAEALPPDPAEYAEAARRLEHSMHHPKRWGGYIRTSPTGIVIPARGWHSGGFRSAKITADTTEFAPDFEDLATLGNTLLELFVDKLK